MGWDNSGGRSRYYYTLDSNNNTMNSTSKVPICIVVCTQKSYKISGSDAEDFKEINLGGWQTVYHNFTPWKVVSSRVQLVRYYAASTAKVTLAIDLPDMNGTIPPPGLNPGNPNKKLNSYAYNPLEVVNFTNSGYEEQTYELRPEMNIEIYMGYIDKFDSVEGYISKSASGYVVNPKRFTKVFNGVIDTVDMKLGRGENPADGVTCTIVARDQMRYLIDNKFFGSLNVEGSNFGSPAGVSRNSIVRALITQGSAGACTPGDNNILFHPSGRPPMKIAGLYEKDTTGASAQNTEVLAGAGVPFSIADQFPVDAVRWFSLIETLPRELYCDIESGNIAWTIRMLGEPYKTSSDANLFGKLFEKQEDLFEDSADYYGELVDSAKLDKIILHKLNTHTKSTNIVFNISDAKTLSSLIQNVYNQYPEQFRKLYPLAYLFAMLDLESGGFNPYVNFDASSNTAYTTSPRQPVLKQNWRQETIPFNTGASGMSQILLNTHYQLALKVSNNNPQLFTNYEEKILDITDVSRSRRSNIPRPVKYYIHMQLLIINSLMNESWGGTLPSISSLYSSKRITADTAQKLVIRAYHSRFNTVLRDLVNSRQQFTYADYKIGADQKASASPNTSVQDNVKYLNVVLARAEYYREAIELVKTEGSSQPSSTTSPNQPSNSPADESVAPYGIAVLRGEDDPWIYTYKKTVNATIINSETNTAIRKISNINPNIISAHASWSTLGMITKFTLLNPSSSKGIGNVGVRISHSLFGDPLANIGVSQKDNLKKIFRGEVGLPDTNSNPDLFKDPEALKNLNSSTRDFSSNDLANVNKPLTVSSINAPLKFLSKIRYPVRHRYVWDESSDSKISDTVADLILNSMMSIYSQDINAVDFLVPLNPDMRPGHVVQMYNLGYFNAQQFRVEGVIHMFASGGVQNGCTTMAVGVSTQGAQNPVKAVELLNNIMKLQSLSSFTIGANSNKGSFEGDPDQTISVLKNYVDQSPEVLKNMDFTDVDKFFDAYDNVLSKSFAVLKILMLATLPTTQSEATKLALDEAKKFALNFIEAYKLKNTQASGDINEEKFKVIFKTLVRRYLFNHISSSLGNSYSFTPDYSNPAWNSASGVDLLNATKNLSNFISDIGTFMQKYALLPYLEKVSLDDSIYAYLRKLSRSTGSEYALDFFSDLHNSEHFKSFIDKNKTIIEFRYAAGLLPHSIGGISYNLFYSNFYPGTVNKVFTSTASAKNKVKAIKNINYKQFILNQEGRPDSSEVLQVEGLVEALGELTMNDFYTGEDFKKRLSYSYIAQVYLSTLYVLKRAKEGKEPRIQKESQEYLENLKTMNNLLAELRTMLNSEKVTASTQQKAGESTVKPIQR
jgi:hypothetical protein